MSADMIQQHFQNMASRIERMGGDGGSPCPNGDTMDEESTLEPMFGGFPVPRKGFALSYCPISPALEGCDLKYDGNKKSGCCNMNGKIRCC